MAVGLVVRGFVGGAGRVTSKIAFKATGPLFNKGAGNRIMRSGVGGAVKELTEMGEQRLDQMLRLRPAGVYLSVHEAKPGQASKGNYRNNLHASVRGLEGRIDDGGVIYGPWLEGTSSRNQSTRFKGYASFRRTAQRLEKQKPRVVEWYMRKTVRRLG